MVAAKQRVARQRGARFGAPAFVTGGIDPVPDRSAFLTLFDVVQVPVLVLRGEQTPPRSAAQMQVLATLPDVAFQRVPGAVSPHEEHPGAFAPHVLASRGRHLSGHDG